MDLLHWVAQPTPDDLTHWMRAALSVATQALPRDVPVGAVLLQPGLPPVTAHNRREMDADPLGHAELLALRDAARLRGDWRLTDAILVVTLEPCPMCAAAIAQARVRRVIYGATDAKEGACGSRYSLLTDSPACSLVGGVLGPTCAAQLRASFRERG